MGQLDTNDKIDKFNYLSKLAEEKTRGNIADKLAASTIYAGQVEFLTIQAARLMEQVLAKGKLELKKDVTFNLHEDGYFYEKHNGKFFTARYLLKGIKKLLPLKDENSQIATKINKQITDFIKAASIFLDKRNDVIHGLGDPNNSLDDIIKYCKESFELYKEVLEKSKIMFESLAPYRPTADQLKILYKQLGA